MPKRGIPKNSMEKSLSHRTQKLHGRTLPYFKKIMVSKIFMEKGRREYHGFPSNVFCLTVPKNFVEEPFGVSKKFWYRKVLWIRGVGVSPASVNFFLSHKAKNVVLELFCVSDDSSGY